MLHVPILLHQLFFALRVPPSLAHQLTRVGGTTTSVRDRVAAERLHLTLFILDDLPTVDLALVEMLQSVGAQVRLSSFDVVLERLIATNASVALCPRGRPVALEDLHDQLVIGCRASGVHRRKNSRFSPHVTLGYHPRATRNEVIAPIGWHASELMLIDSHVGQTRHEVLGCWPLAGDPPRQLSLL